jgi:GlpG protein
VAHRIFEEGGRQVLEVQGGEQQARQVASLYQAWRRGEVRIELSGQGAPGVVRPGSGLRLRSAPVTVLLVALSLVGFLLVYFQAPLTWLGQFTFTPFEVVQGKLQFEPMGGQYWRLLTPAFLHFGWLHIVFNCLWLWELGSKVERVMGSVNMLLLFMVIALVSNTSQFVFGSSRRRRSCCSWWVGWWCVWSGWWKYWVSVRSPMPHTWAGSYAAGCWGQPLVCCPA